MAEPVPLRVRARARACFGAPVDRHGAPVDGGIVVVVISKVVPYKASEHAVSAAAAEGSSKDENVSILASRPTGRLTSLFQRLTRKMLRSCA